MIIEAKDAEKLYEEINAEATASGYSSTGLIHNRMATLILTWW
jgi:hypothetical protein